MKTVKAGVIGCGNISSVYLGAFSRFDHFNVIACGDIDEKRAEHIASKFGISRSCSVEELLAMDDIDLVINLTVPQAHATISKKALCSGKHVYSEKPMALHVAEMLELQALALSRGLRIGCAPDTFMGGGLQTALNIVRNREIGDIIGANAFSLSAGHETWHPNPHFYYKQGGGPLMDMGPYLLTYLISLMGPVDRVFCEAKKSFQERIITSEPCAGEVIEVEVPTHYSAVMKHVNGSLVTMSVSFDVKCGTDLPHLEIYGTKGTLRINEPYFFDSPVFKYQEGIWESVPLNSPFLERDCWRGLGAVQMASAIEQGEPHLASFELALHVHEIMEGLHASSNSGTSETMKYPCMEVPLFTKQLVSTILPNGSCNHDD